MRARVSFARGVEAFDPLIQRAGHAWLEGNIGHAASSDGWRGVGGWRGGGGGL